MHSIFVQNLQYNNCIGCRYWMEPILRNPFEMESCRFFFSFLRRSGGYFDSSASWRQPPARLRQTLPLGGIWYSKYGTNKPNTKFEIISGLAFPNYVCHRFACRSLAILQMLDERLDERKCTKFGPAVYFCTWGPGRPVYNILHSILILSAKLKYCNLFLHHRSRKEIIGSWSFPSFTRRRLVSERRRLCQRLRRHPHVFPPLPKTLARHLQNRRPSGIQIEMGSSKGGGTGSAFYRKRFTLYYSIQFTYVN